MDWLDSRELINKWSEHPEYLQCDVGIRTINPLKIVGLSRPFDDIADDARMEHLRNQAAVHGWMDQEKDHPHICLLPDMRLVVCQNGNHRTILAREMGLQRMRVHLLVMVPKREISDWLMKKYLECERELDHCIERLWEADDQEDEKDKKRLDRISQRLESRCRSISAYIGKQYLKGINLL